MRHTDITVSKCCLGSDSLQVRISGYLGAGDTEQFVYFSAELSKDLLQTFSDELTLLLETPVQVTAEIVSEGERIDNAPRNPLSLGDDALGENESPIAQADGDPGDCHYVQQS